MKKYMFVLNFFIILFRALEKTTCVLCPWVKGKTPLL